MGANERREKGRTDRRNALLDNRGSRFLNQQKDIGRIELENLKFEPFLLFELDQHKQEANRF